MTHRVGAKGQVVLPKALRDGLGIVPGSEVVFAEDDGAVRVIPVRTGPGLKGLFHRSGMTERLEADRRAEPR
jgi:AbrB family looped-hinge helix DNA binding protein